MSLNAKSVGRLVGVHPDLCKVVLTASQSGTPFFVIEGKRSPERQEMLVAAGKSRTLNSRHIHGMAVDLGVSTLDGGVSWHRDDYKMLALTVKSAAIQLGIPIVWGGDWISFFDGVHFELDRRFYPDPVPDLVPPPGTTNVA